MPLHKGARVGRYVILECIGKGGMGVVYGAQDQQLDRRVALKMVAGRLDAAHLDRVVKEAQALAKLSSPHVVTVHEVGTEDGRCFIAMEFVRGQTLTAWLRTPRGWREVLRMFGQAGRGLADAHRAGIVHRDLNPTNVLVDAAGRVKVCDFGIAIFEEEGDQGSPAGSPSVPGTRRYMSPELLRGEHADVRSDVYAFAVSVAEALARIDIDASLATGLEQALERAEWPGRVPEANSRVHCGAR